MQLGGLAGLGGASPPPELLKALQYNPLLYYSYYAQMLTALQAQQKLLESAQTNLNNNNNNSSSIKDILSPLKLANKEQSNTVRCHSSSFLVQLLDTCHCKCNNNQLHPISNHICQLAVQQCSQNVCQIETACRLTRHYI